MLFSYTYVPHQMEQMQAFIDYIFHDVWCKASAQQGFSLDLFDGLPALREVMRDFYFANPQPKDAEFFYDHVERIYGHFQTLTDDEIAQFKYWYWSNNDLLSACANSPGSELARYSDIEPKFKELSEKLESFFKGLYGLDVAALKAKVGDIDSYYTAFMAVNVPAKCPFCGLSDLLGKDHGPREAYDHYLPKALYPFNSINFRNLVPACHHCNSSYKTSKDPAHVPKRRATAGQRRKFFYPYSVTPHTLELQVSLKHSDIEKLSPEDVDIRFGPAALSEEIETWVDVYGIQERYKAKCSVDGDGKYWLTQVLDEWNVDGRTPDSYLASLSRQTVRDPYRESNFLKKAFLDGCESRGLFV